MIRVDWTDYFTVITKNYFQDKFNYFFFIAFLTNLFNIFYKEGLKNSCENYYFLAFFVK